MKKNQCVALFLILCLCLSFSPISLEAAAAGESDYIEDFTIKTGANKSVYLKANTLNDSLDYDIFEFNPNTKTYDIMLVDGYLGNGVTLADNDLTFTVSPKESNANITKLRAKIVNGSDPAASALGTGWNTQFKKELSLKGVQVLNGVPTMDSVAPEVRSLMVYMKSENTALEAYTFNFYRKATLREIIHVSYEDGTPITEGLPETFDPYQNNYEINNVAAGTTKLVITAPAYTQQDTVQDTVLKFDNGSNSYVVGNDTYCCTLDLTAYGDSYKQPDGSLLIPFWLDYTGDGCGVDGCYTLKVNMEKPRYIEDFTIKTGANKSVYLKANTLNDSLDYDVFKFDPNITTYDIMLVDGYLGNGVTLADNDLTFTVSPKESNSSITKLRAKMVSGSDPTAAALGTGWGTQFKKELSLRGVQVLNGVPRMDSATPEVRSLMVYMKGEDTALEAYTFNFYRKATLSGIISVSYEDGSPITEGLPETFDPYQNNYEINNVAAGTTKLVITASAYTQQDTVLKFDDGTGKYIAGPTATTFILNLADYVSSNYKQEDGSLLIPFKLEYDQTVGGCGVDGCYTLSVKFSESTQNNTINGYIKNITIETTKLGKILFNAFQQEETEYDIVPLPMQEGSGQNTFQYRYNINVDLYDEENWNDYRYSLSVESLSGEVLRLKEGIAFTGATVDVSNLTIPFSDGKLGGILDALTIGEYIFKVKVFKADTPESADEYTFRLKFEPVIVELLAYAGDKELIVSPTLEEYDGLTVLPDSYFVRDISIDANGESIVTIKGRQGGQSTYPDDARVIYKDQDRTSDFSENGISISLVDYQAVNGVYSVPITVVHDATNTHSEYTLLIAEGEKSEWQITGQPQGGTFNKGENVSLTVVTNATEGEVSYQWQSTTTQFGFTNGTSEIITIPGATNAEFLVPSSIGGQMYYRCKVTDVKSLAVQYSDIAEVTINLGQVNPPVIVYQPGVYASFADMSPYRTEYTEGEKIDFLQVMAGSAEGLQCEIAWYYNTQASTQGAVLLDAENYHVGISTGFSVDAVGHIARCKAYSCSYNEHLSVGIHYFYCVITVGDENNNASTTSQFVKITVFPRDALEGFEGKGTAEEPYLLKTVEDLERIRSYVESGNSLSGAIFKFDNDISLPIDWVPIGLESPELLAFGGIIDGNGKTLTVAKGGKPLLNYARDAIVKNLKIYGEEINGAGLLDRAAIDYGADGVYQPTDPDIITLENVTLLGGSKTAGSGLVNGGYTSGINNIFIKDCHIEKDVVVGYNKDHSNIGSFVGTLNGRIENSISYATVYGINNVGGLAGVKGQSMGICEVINSAFLGSVEASGGLVGGILGAGYIASSAPNVPPVTVRNCYVVADITGNSASTDGVNYNGSGIGGIVGSEAGLESTWNEAYISDNYFYGTITDTNPDAVARYAHIGGILGEVGSYNPSLQHYENNYYLSNGSYGGLGYLRNANPDWNPEEESFIPKDAEAFADCTVTALLNQGAYKNWIQGEDGFPIHTDAVIPLELTISGDYDPDYYIGDTLDMSEAVFTITYSDGTKETVDWTDVEFSGFDMSAQGVYTVTATWGPLSAKFEIRVLLNNPDAITVSFVLYGDAAHGDNGEIHTLDESNLTVWIARADYEINENTTVLDVFVAAAEKAGLTWVNDKGNYISSITNGDITLEEFTNGPNSGWMYTLNGVHPKNSIVQQFLTDGDCILFHYTDDYEVETGMTDVAIRNMEMDTRTLTVKAGETAELSVSFEPELLNGNVRIDWTSADTGIATVKNGVVTGLSEGETTITAEARDAGFHVTATVTVTPGDDVVQVESVTVSPETLTLTVGETETLTATVLPDNATSKDVQWSSSDESIATVSSKGVVTAVKAGTAAITATAGGKSATVTITVEAEEIAVTGVTLNKTSVSVAEEETVTLKATVSPSNATNKTVTWSSSDEDVATVKDGVVIGISAGTATITAQVGTYSATCEVTVTAADKTVKNLNIVDDENADNFANVTSFVETAVDGEGNKTKTAALTVDSTRINDEGEVEDIPCMVIVKNPDGSYERLKAKANPDGSYTFVKENYSEDMEFFVAVMGDTNLDGKLSIADMLLARAAMLGKVSLDDLAFMVSDLDGVNGLTIADILKARAYSLNMTTLDW